MAGPIGFGVAGLGRIGRLHAEILKVKVEGARLVAVNDVVEGLARSAGERLRVKWYTDYDKMLRDEEIDAVVIATPTYLHKDMIIRALEEGKHVFVEKPMTVTSSEASEVLRVVSKTGLKLQVGYMRRFDPSYASAKREVDSGRIGRVVAFISIARDPGAPPGWAADPSKSGGIFLDMLSHDFDLARWLVSDEVAEVYVVGGNYLYDEIRERGDLDVASIAFRFSGGAQGLIHGARKSVFGYELRTEVYGTEGTVYVGERFDNTLAIGSREGVTFRGVSWFEKRFYDAYVNELTDFVKAITEDRKPLVNEVDGYKVIRIAEACWESFRSGKPVTVSY